MSERTRIRFLRDWGPRRLAGHVEDLPSHIARALCEGDEPFAILEDGDGVQYDHRAITETARTPRPKAKRPRRKTKKTTTPED
jgi:hypothetical protein